MQIIETRVREGNGVKAGFTVDFIGDGNERQDSDAPSEASEAVKSLNQERKDDNRSGSALQEGLEDSFPASDPVSATYTSTAATEQKPEQNH